MAPAARSTGDARCIYSSPATGLDARFIREPLRRSVSTARYTEFLSADGRNARKPRPVGRAGTGGRGRPANHARQSAASGRHRDAGARRATCMHAGARVLAHTCSCKLRSHSSNEEQIDGTTARRKRRLPAHLFFQTALFSLTEREQAPPPPLFAA
jgi:hypothetical protein